MAAEDPAARLDAALRDLGGTTLDLADGERLFRAGEAREAVYRVAAGYLKLVRNGADGTERIVALMGGGSLLGLDGLWEPKERTAAHEVDAVAAGGASVHRVARSAFRRLLEERGDLARPVVEQLSSRQRAADRRLELLLVADARGRVAGTLAELAGRQGQRCPHGHEVDVPLTQGELAQLAGLSRQVTSATLNALREEGLIDYTRDHLCVNDLRALGAAALSST